MSIFYVTDIFPRNSVKSVKLSGIAKAYLKRPFLTYKYVRYGVKHCEGHLRSLDVTNMEWPKVSLRYGQFSRSFF